MKSLIVVTSAWQRLTAILCLLTAACASLPDVAPFADATLQFRSAVVSSGNAVEAELAAVPETAAEARTFSEAWAVRVQAAEGLVTYSRSIVAIAGSATESADSVKSVADSLQELAKVANVALPATATVAAVTDTATFIYGQIAAVRASRALSEALTNAQPAIDQLAALMAKDFDSAEPILRAANMLSVTKLRTQYNVETGHYKMLMEERKKIYGKDQLSREDEKRLIEIGALIEATRSWREPMLAEEKRLGDQLQGGRRMIAMAKQTLTEWALAHHQLAVAVKDGRKVDVSALVASTQEMQQLIRRIREL